ncbi:dual oxidase maturation factor 1-like [Sycon ciliatum]|uniref:dual oxidase maturation factor 1-like n=1 Tax=Sycon ciliatum TaxID=27933 RepID=UPI0031F660A6
MGNTFTGGYFTSFRHVPAPTLYGPNRSPVTQDILEIGLITAFVMTWFCVLLASIGILFVNWRKCLQQIGKATFFFYFITCILVSIWGFGWRVGTVHTEATYKQFSTAVISADVGLKVGLYSFNVTLKGSPTNQSGDIVDYNEHYNFGVLQGRLGFGSQAGVANQEFRTAQYRGTPLPILWVAEYFTLDGEQIRWGRNYRQAGYYTALLLWTAFCFFILTVLMLPGALTYGANMLMLTGLTLIISCCVYAGLHRELGPSVVIPFESGMLTLNYGWSFILTLVNGIVLMFCGVLLWILYLRFPDILESLLGIQVEDDEDDVLPLFPGQATGPSVIENVASAEHTASTPSAMVTSPKRDIRAPAIGHLDKSVSMAHSSMDASTAELQSSVNFQSRPIYVPDRGLSLRRLRRTKRKKPREGATSPTTLSPVPQESGDMEMSSMPGPPSSLSESSASPLDPQQPVAVSVKGAVGRKAFSLTQSSSHQKASFEMHYPALAEGDERPTPTYLPSPLGSPQPAPTNAMEPADTELEEV